MPAKNPMTTSTRELKPRLSATERRAAQVAGLATQQSDLKREAAERRLAAAQDDPAAGPGTRRSNRRSNRRPEPR